MSEHQEQMEPIIMLERMAKGQDATLYPEQRDAIKCLLDRIKELEQQRDAALKLADEILIHRVSPLLRDSEWVMGRMDGKRDVANKIRAIFAPKDEK